MEQPKVYNTEEELIKWLEYDLKEQRKEYFDYTGNPVDEMELEDFLILNIGNKDTNYKRNININFKLSIRILMIKLTNKYKDSLDKDLIDLERKKINYKINCNSVIFNEEVNFSYTYLRKADFSYTIFNKKVNFNKSKFFGVCKFVRATFNEEINFSNSEFKDKVYFIGAQFIVENKEKSKNNIIFEDTTFSKEVTFYKASFYDISFFGTIFNEFVNFSDVSFNSEANFSIVLFNNGVNFDNNSFLNITNFYIVIFKNGVNFYKTSFIDSAKFSGVSFYNETCFSEVSFNRAKFLDSNFYYNKNKCEYCINDNNKIDFSHITINDYLELDNTNIQDYTEIVFDNMIFKDNKSYLSIKNIKKDINRLSLKDITIDGKINIQDLEVNTVDFEGSVTNGGLVNPVNFEVDKFANRKSALFLKNEAYARNNIIDALEYKAKEIEMHKEELKIKNNKDYKDWGDIISIELSSIYSDNGLNWIKSFICTILFPIFFFTMSYNISCIPIFIIAFISLLYVLLYNKNISKRIFISSITYIIISIVFSFIYFEGYNNIGYVIRELFSFIAPTNFSQILYDKKYLSYIYDCKSNIKIICFIEIVFKGIFYFLGKIAFWYGSVQTVQSFRKFSKKE